MNPDRWRRIEEVYHGAAARPAAERAAFLTQACTGDEELRVEVEQLLAASAAATAGLVVGGVPATGRGLVAGGRLGAYLIQEQIGAGGMGHVYRARDTKLGRDVALKILPEHFTADPERLARFEREARVLAALNHPHIATIYGVEDSTDTKALVMELVEGPTLADLIARGAIPVHEALPIAKQMTDALEVAHEQGIIHRDLKPANIKVRSDGTVKVLDFGLAKVMEPAVALRAAAGQAVSQAPTVPTPAMTHTGVILGTVAYMSPEQALGTAVDRRTDLWAFGAVLYEMLVGERVFDGAGVADTLAAVLKTSPDWTRLPEDTPAQIRKLLRRCLEKDRRHRLADASDARLEVEEALARAEGATPSGAMPRVASSRPLWVALTVAVLAATGLAFVHLREPQPALPAEMRTEIVTPATGDPMSFALSPDGTQIVYSAVSEGVPGLWLRALGTATTQLLSETEDGRLPFWSPDGRSIGFFSRGALKRLDLGSGALETLAETGFVPAGGTWFPDGSIVFASDRMRALLRVSATGGTPTVVSGLGSQFDIAAPHGLPDGRRFLFLALDGGRSSESGIYLGSLEGTPPRQLVSATRPGAYLADRTGSTGGWLLWVREGGTLMGQRLDMAQAALVGEPVTVSDGIAEGRENTGVSVSASGLVAYRLDTGSSLRLTWVDRSGTALATVGEEDATLGTPRVAPDGRRALVSRTAQGNTDVWMVDGARATRLTFHRAPDWAGEWSSDGTRFVFRSMRSGVMDLYLGLVGSPGSEERLVASDQSKVPNSWSRDGRFLIYGSIDPTDGTDLWVLPMEGGQTPTVFLKTPFTERNADVSPDGRWVAYQSNASGRDEVYVRPFVLPGTASPVTGEWQISTEGGRHPAWSPDGRELYYVNPGSQLMAVPIAASRGIMEPGAPAVVFPTPVYPAKLATSASRQYDIAPDGRFLILRSEDDVDMPITLLQNWRPPNTQ